MGSHLALCKNSGNTKRTTPPRDIHTRYTDIQHRNKPISMPFLSKTLKYFLFTLLIPF